MTFGTTLLVSPMLDAEVACAKIVPSAFNVQLVQLSSKFFSRCPIKVNGIVIFIINFIEVVLHFIFYFYIFKYNVWLLKKISLEKLFAILWKYFNLIYFIKFLFVFIIFMLISITCQTTA
jgi:hypothetical protein